MDGHSAGTSLILLRRELFDKVRESQPSLQDISDGKSTLYTYILDKFQIRNPSEDFENEIKSKLEGFLKVLKRKWMSCHRALPYFISKNETWLESNMEISNIDAPGSSTKETAKKRGRPEKNFSETTCQKTKKRKLENFLHEKSMDELCFAAEKKLRQVGKRDAALIVKDILQSPKRATKIKRAFYKVKKNESVTASYTHNEALALIVSTKLTKNQYEIMRKGSLDKGITLYPSYHNIKKAKQMCYPQECDLIISESEAEIKLQGLVYLTLTRLLSVENLFTKLTEVNISLILLCKWGTDGCGSLTRYKQPSSEPGLNDSSVIVSSFVPLRLFVPGKETNIIWENPRPSSTRLCRPIRFRFKKESEEEIVSEISHIRTQIQCLNPLEITMWEKNITVSFQFLETMVDGKICNSMTGNRSTQTCYICGATPKEMNNLNAVRSKECKEETFSWGLSILHGYIRFMECLLHIAYKLNLKKWQSKSAEEKLDVSDRKKHIIDRFREETGLLVDMPKQGGGNTNDGNTARRFFLNADVTANITGINKVLIERFGTILRALSSGISINNLAFEKYTLSTAKLYVDLYGWYPMPVTVHKILIHGTSIIKQFLIPIGQLSEDVQETRHKELKQFRENHTRKCSRKKTNRDILNNLLVSSDPVITSLRPLPPLRSKDYGPVKELLNLPDDIPQEDVSNESDLNSSDNETELSMALNDLSM